MVSRNLALAEVGVCRSMICVTSPFHHSHRCSPRSLTPQKAFLRNLGRGKHCSVTLPISHPLKRKSVNFIWQACSRARNWAGKGTPWTATTSTHWVLGGTGSCRRSQNILKNTRTENILTSQSSALSSY